MGSDRGGLPPVLIRADGGEATGLGHVVRCMAIAEVLRKREVEVAWLGRLGAESLRSGLDRLGVRYEELLAEPGSDYDLRRTRELLSEIAKTDAQPWFLLDSSQLGLEHALCARECGSRIAIIDDTARQGSYVADVIINPNGGSEKFGYNCSADTVLLLGSSFTLVRREVREARREARNHPPLAKRVLVTMGGADPPNVTSKVIHALSGIPGSILEIDVIVGPANPWLTEIEQEAAACPHRVRVVRSPPEFAQMAASADLSLTSASGTAWELAFLGTPMLTIQLAHDQQGVAARLSEAGAAVDLGWHRDVAAGTITTAVESLIEDQDRRVRLNEAGSALIDGRGAERVADVLAAVSNGRFPITDVTVRPAEARDRFQIWRLANDPTVRENSFTTAMIPLDDHLRWFEAKVNERETAFLVLDFASLVVAHARYERAGNSAEVHFAVAPAFRGRGLGSQVLRETLRLACGLLEVEHVVGTVIEGNEASDRAFRAAGYVMWENGIIRGKPCHQFKIDCGGEVSS